MTPVLIIRLESLSIAEEQTLLLSAERRKQTRIIYIYKRAAFVKHFVSFPSSPVRFKVNFVCFLFDVFQ